MKTIGDETFARIRNTNGWFECGVDGKPIFNRGEVEVAEKVAKAFPDFEVRVTIGPYRFHDIAHKVNLKEKLITIDLYSVHPGLRYLKGIIGEIKGFVESKKTQGKQ